MGFLDNIRVSAAPEYRPFFLNYATLKEQIKVSAMVKRSGGKLRASGLPHVGRITGGLKDEGHASVFHERLFSELQKVNKFAEMKHEEVFVQLRQICYELDKLKKNDHLKTDKRNFEDIIQTLEKRTQALSNDIFQLDIFIRYNYLGFAKIAEKYDLVMEQHGGTWFLSRLHKEPFCNISFDDLLILLSLTWSRWREVKDSVASGDDAQWKPPDNFTRKTYKFWVRLEKVILLKASVLRHMPYLIFGQSTKTQEKFLQPLGLVENKNKEPASINPFLDTYATTTEESQLLTSIYFDNTQATSYQERIFRQQGARLVRFRWYGENDGSVEKEVFIERKIHHEAWSLDDSTKERFSLPQKQIFSFMKGKFDIDEHFDKVAQKTGNTRQIEFGRSLAKEVNSLIQTRGMQPLLRTSYYRCAFQLATSNEVRISLDTTMMLINEFQPGGHPNEPWCRVATDTLAEDDIVRFPYAILEVKLAGVDESPAWVQDILNTCECTQVYKFSKFQHGMAFLHPEMVPVLPHWFEDFHQMRMCEGVMLKGNFVRRANTVGSRPVSQMHSKDSEAFSIMLRSQDSTILEDGPLMAAKRKGYHAIKDIHLIEPKLFFANERTFLHYIEYATLSVALIHFLVTLGNKPCRLAGCIMGPFVVTFIVWCYVEYENRNVKLRERLSATKIERRLDARRGPHVVLAVVCTMMTISLWLSLRFSGKKSFKF